MEEKAVDVGKSPKENQYKKGKEWVTKESDIPVWACLIHCPLCQGQLIDATDTCQVVRGGQEKADSFQVR